MCETILINDGITLTRENQNTKRETRPSATLFTTNPTRSDLGHNAALRGDRPATDRQSLWAVVEHDN